MKPSVKHFLAEALLFSVVAGCAVEVTPDFRIVAPASQNSVEHAAVELLSDHLAKVFDRKPETVVRDKAEPGKPSIELVSDPRLGAEEWRIRAENNRIRISGGVPRGLYYGVCEFLERFAGIRWFTAWETRIPKAKSLQVPAGEIGGAPAFPVCRYVYDTVGHFGNMVFHGRNRATGFSGGAPDRKRLSDFSAISIGNGHTFYRLAKALPKELEHCLPVDGKGVRIRSKNPEGPGQICFSHPEFRAFAKKEIARWIAEERALLKKHGMAGRAIGFIDLSMNDNQNFCQCAGCRELCRKYGAVSGALLEFVNDIASAFPGETFQTFAYGKALEPPTGIRARENVMVQFAFLSLNGKSVDLLRPLSSPTNAKVREYYEKWSAVADMKAVWAYHRVFGMTEMFPWPQCCYWYIPEDIRFHHGIGIRKFFAESEYKGSPRAFHDLHVYLALRMLNRPECDARKAIDEFFDFQYGPAAPAMRKYADYLKKRLDAVPGVLNHRPLPSRSCFDREFFSTIDGFLTEAEKMAGDDRALLNRIAIERIPVDMAALYMWEKYGKLAFSSREQLCDRLEICTGIMLDRYFPDRSKVRDALLKSERSRIARLRNPIPIPQGMEDRNIVQTPAVDGDPSQLVDDPDALYGKALKCPPVSGKWAHDRNLLQFGIYDMTEKRHVLNRMFLPKELAQDEKYHLYLLGKAAPDVYHRNSLWGHVTWRMRLEELLKPALDVTDPEREMEIWISLKVTGPAYVKGSRKENAVFVDKVVCVKLDHDRKKTNIRKGNAKNE